MEAEALPDFVDRLPGGGLSLGGLGLGLLVVVAVMAQQGTPAQRAEFNRSIERGIGAAVGGIARYIAGRELVTEPRSEATWWRAGAPLPDDRATETPIDQLGKDASQGGAGVSLDKSNRPGSARFVLDPVRALFGALEGLWRVLSLWHRWPYAVRSVVRLLPLLVGWGLWRYPHETQLALIAVAVTAYLAAFTGPSGLALWRVQPVWTDRQIYGPGVWAGVRQILRMEDKEPRARWLSIPDEMNADGAEIVLRLPVSWVGGPEGVSAIERIVELRVPGEWIPEWNRTEREHYVRWTQKPKPVPKPVLPQYVPWKSTSDPRRVFVGLAIDGDRIVEVEVHTKTATPHWGVAGATGSGKSTVLYIPVVHARQHGELIDILDTKRNSLAEAEGFSGVRIHKTVRECVAAFAEFLTSAMAAEAAVEKGADPALRAQLVPRTLVVDELPTLIKLAYTWWRYGLKGKGTPPFLDWLSITLLTGRSSDHRVVVGSQQFANAYFGGTMERAQIGTKMTVGQQDRISWSVAFGQSTPVISYDTSIPGRGAYTDQRQDPGSDHVRVLEIQPSYITPQVRELLSQCVPAPDWFDTGQLAPWITPELLDEVNATAATGNFLPGGKYGPSSLPAVASAGARGITVGNPSSQRTTAAIATADATPGATGAGAGSELVKVEDQEEELPETYSLAAAYERGILPWKASTTRTYFKRGSARGINPPEGVSDGQTSYYSEDELRSWHAEWVAWQERKNTAPRRADDKGEEGASSS
ncbi:hypothetical protein ACIPSE_45185 [Streptomyces sp. NPDC090106]|uniref:type IV secretory system conjugative DNA transfer family protein n=1 Tax=Streptomyces sp. NPDC090106 TaxID=3365946 RepID=UPI00381938CC